jgi:hypothetical protein
MSLKDEFRESAMVENGLTTLEKYEQIADEFAIGFADFVYKLRFEDNDIFWKSTEDLLEIYKKEKGL